MCTAESISLSGPGYSRPNSSLPPEVINSFEKEQSEPKIKQDEKQGHDLSITSLVKRMEEQVNETTAEKSVLNPNTTVDSKSDSGYSRTELIPDKIFGKRISENGGTEYLVMWKGFFFKDKVRSKYPRS